MKTFKYKKILVLCVAVLIPLFLLYKVTMSQFFAQKIGERYDLQGVDVSHFQGTIDWQEIESQGIGFTYIKATEGSSFVDENLDANYNAVKETDIAYGFYHFISLDSPAETQMENFKKAVEGYDMKLVPAIDIEWYGDQRNNPPDKEKVLSQLKELSDLMEKEYGQKPVIYTTQTYYLKFLAGEIEDFPLWIRNVYTLPAQNWVIWQYTDRAVLEGYKGEEKYIDRDATDAERLNRIMMK